VRPDGQNLSMRVLLLTEDLPGLPGWETVADEVIEYPSDRVPSTPELGEVDVVCVLGQVRDPERAQQLTGVIRLALGRPLIVIVAYGTVADEGLQRLIGGLLDITANRSAFRSGVASLHPTFDNYFEVFGQSYVMLQDVADLEVLGTAELDGATRTTAACIPVRTGVVYLLPYFLAGANDQFVPALFDAVLAHAEGASSDTVPGFLAGLRLPGEHELLLEIAEAEGALADLRDREADLARFRHLVGRATGGNLERLVIDALNQILEGSGYRAEDREDVRAEDFWLVGPEEDFGIVEVKGQNSHVRRDDVNQVDSHRDEIGEQAHNLPGLLVVNIFRGHEDLEQRQLPVAEQVIRRAAGSNVLVLRTIDVYNLLHQALAGRGAGATLLEALRAGGGWLEVATEEAVLHRE